MNLCVGMCFMYACRVMHMIYMLWRHKFLVDFVVKRYLEEKIIELTQVKVEIVKL